MEPVSPSVFNGITFSYFALQSIVWIRKIVRWRIFILHKKHGDKCETLENRPQILMHNE